MKVFAQDQHITIQASAEMIAEFRKYMHVADGQDFLLPRGVRVCYRGFGWYRLVAQRDHDVQAKLAFAHNIVKKFLRDYARDQAELKRITTANPKRPTIAFVSDAERSFVSMPKMALTNAVKQTPVVSLINTAPPVQAAPLSKLQALANHFNARR